MRLSLKSRIHLLFAALIMAVGFGVAGVFSLLSGNQVNQQIKQDAASARNLLSNQMRERSVQLKNQTALVAELQALRSLLLSRVDQATVSDWANEYVRRTSADDLVVTNSSGKVIGQGSKLNSHYGVKDLPGIEAAIGGEVWTGVIAHQPNPMLGVTVPVTNAGYVIGTVTAFQAIDSRTACDLRDILGTDVLFVSNKRVVGSSLDYQATMGEVPIDATRMKIGKTEYVALYAPLPRTNLVQGLGFVTLQRYDLIAGPYRSLKILFMIVMMLGLALAGIVSRSIANTITQPLDEVISAAGTVKEGEWPDEMVIKRNDEIGFLQNVFNDMIRALRESREKLLAMIDIDPLTDLCNHSRFLERLDHEVKRSVTNRDEMTLLLIDLDNFSQYNANSGHAAGDQVLRRVADAIRRHTPDIALRARYGGEEFAVVLPETGISDAAKIAEELREQIKREFVVEGLTASIGCAELDRATNTGSGLVLASELALSLAKQLGKDQVSTTCAMVETPYQLNDLASGDLATIQALAAAVDAKDSYTQGHSERVARYAYDLAKYVGVGEDEAKLIYRTGTLHDVGKIGVPDAILKKPGRLTPEEEAVMQTHPALGEVIVRKVPQLADTLPGVRHHHERWDGGGYPDNLKGEAIPKVARFLAIADTFDAMTSDRPYRKGMAPEIAIDEIERNAGKQFDPELALAFGRLMRRKIQRAA